MAFAEKRQRLLGLIAQITLNPKGLEIGIHTAYLHHMLQHGEEISACQPIILPGRQPANLNAHNLMADTRAPIDWHEQRAGFGFV